MNSMNLPNGGGSSPDGGRFWVKKNLLYWSDGSVWDMNDGGVIRTINFGHRASKDYEDYSAWSKSKRARVLAKSRKGYALYARRQRRQQRAIDALRQSARAKLTAKEIIACNL